MTLSTVIILSSINLTFFAVKRSTSQNRNPEISVRLHYLFVELTTIVKLVIPMKVNIDTPFFPRPQSKNPVSTPGVTNLYCIEYKSAAGNSVPVRGPGNNSLCMRLIKTERYA